MTVKANLCRNCARTGVCHRFSQFNPLGNGTYRVFRSKHKPFHKGTSCLVFSQFCGPRIRDLGVCLRLPSTPFETLDTVLHRSCSGSRVLAVGRGGWTFQTPCARIELPRRVRCQEAPRTTKETCGGAARYCSWGADGIGAGRMGADGMGDGRMGGARNCSWGADGMGGGGNVGHESTRDMPSSPRSIEGESNIR